MPVAGAAGGSAIGVSSALGADGTAAIAWAAGGTGHVTVVGPGGGVVADATLPGGGVNSIDAGVTSDGAVVVAYRTKESAKSYTLRVATMAAGTTAFGDAVALQSGPAVDSIDVATGGGEAVAIAYRQLAAKYRTRVAVRPRARPVRGRRGDEPRRRRGRRLLAARGVRRRRVARGRVGQRGRRAVRGAAAGGAGAAFGDAQALGSGPAYDVDLSGAPGGGAAVSYASSGSVWAAAQGAPGGTFSAPVQAGPSFTSNLTVDTAVTAAPDGTVTTLWADPTTGAVHAVDAGGADVTVGYGSREAVTPVSIASAADRTLAAWTTAAGTVVAATRSASVTPAKPGDLGPAPAGRDTTRPKVTLPGAPKHLKVTTKTQSVALKVRCSRPASSS